MSKDTYKISTKELAIIYFKTGVRAYGGWPTTSLILERELIEKRNVLTNKQLHSSTASGQILPGATQIILAAQIAYFIRGVGGTIICILAYLIPSVFATFIFTIIYFTYFRGSDFSRYTIGLQASVSGIVLGNAYRIGKRHVSNNYLWLAVAAACIAKLVFEVPVILIFAFATVSVLLFSTIKNQVVHV